MKPLDLITGRASLLNRSRLLLKPRLFSNGGVYSAISSSNIELNKRLLAKDIPTLPLSYDLYNEKSSSLNPLPPIIILHGLFGCKTNNRTIATQLNEVLERDVFCLDLRNHGDSPHDTRHDYPALAADVERFIEDKGLGKSILIGHSMGAKTAMAVALRRKELVKILVSVDNSPVNLQPSSKFVKYVQILQQIVNNKDIKTQREADKFFQRFEDEVSIRQFLMQNIKRNRNSDGLRSRIPLDIMKDCLVKGKIAAWEFTSDFNRWNGPALFIRGTKSTYIPDEYIPEIGKFFPNFEVRDIEAGHWVIAEQPQETLDVIVDYIERNEDL